MSESRNNVTIGVGSSAEGQSNVVCGSNSQVQGDHNIVAGSDVVVIGSNNTVLASGVRITGDNQTVVGNIYNFPNNHPRGYLADQIRSALTQIIEMEKHRFGRIEEEKTI